MWLKMKNTISNHCNHLTHLLLPHHLHFESWKMGWGNFYLLQWKMQSCKKKTQLDGLYKDQENTESRWFKRQQTQNGTYGFLWVSSLACSQTKHPHHKERCSHCFPRSSEIIAEEVKNGGAIALANQNTIQIAFLESHWVSTITWPHA